MAFCMDAHAGDPFHLCKCFRSPIDFLTFFFSLRKFMCSIHLVYTHSLHTLIQNHQRHLFSVATYTDDNYLQTDSFVFINMGVCFLILLSRRRKTNQGGTEGIFINYTKCSREKRLYYLQFPLQHKEIV